MLQRRLGMGVGEGKCGGMRLGYERGAEVLGGGVCMRVVAERVGHWASVIVHACVCGGGGMCVR
jgi:hypothetical protein